MMRYTNPMNTTDPKAAALDFLRTHMTGVLSTISQAQTPRARTLYYSHDSDFNLYFITLATTRKASDVAAYPLAAFTVTDEHTLQTLQLEGSVTDVTNGPTDDVVIENLFDKLKLDKGQYPPLARLDRGDVRFYRITPSWIRWGDYTAGFHSKDVLFELSPTNET